PRHLHLDHPRPRRGDHPVARLRARRPEFESGRERFGKGAVEGVLGPGAANNSSLGGSLVTTVAFGVPASVATAILMGAFFVQGLVPGPAMLTPAPKGHLAVTLAMVWTIVISNILTVAVCLVFMGPLARIT